MRSIVFVLSFFFIFSVVIADETQPDNELGEVAPATVMVVDEGTAASLNTLNRLIESRDQKQEELNEFNQEIKQAKDEAIRSYWFSLAKKREKEISSINTKIEAASSGSAYGNKFNNEENGDFELNSELQKLFEPIVMMLKSATQDSRQIEELKLALRQNSEKVVSANQAITNIGNLIEANSEEKVTAVLEKQLVRWQEQQAVLQNDAATLDFQLTNLLKSQDSLSGQVGEIFTGFFSERGINLLLGIAVFFAVFFGMRLIQRLYYTFYFRKLRKKRSMYDRVINLVYRVLTVIFSFAAVLIIFNMRNDWLLLGLTLMFFVALGWVLAKMLPQFIEQALLLINLGSVREDERIIIDGIPWHVKVLNFHTTLVNPMLSGASLVLPVRQLIGMHSRPSAHNESWFPSSEGDWVQLNDGNLVAKVIFQSPEMVKLIELGGAIHTIKAVNYIGMNPKNLSHNYRVTSTFGVDYQYQKQSTTDIPQAFEQALRKGIGELLGDKQLIHLSVEFTAAASSSLDYEILADIDGNSAHRYHTVKRAIARILVDVCNENDWVIPFQQITLHQA